jgi:hypothetical protein
MKHTKSVASERRRRRLFTFLWSALIAIGTIALIYWEMTALLYILGTLGVSVLLVIVALSDLRRGEKALTDTQGINDSAALGSGITSTFGANR